jgi:hypothetical protein
MMATLLAFSIRTAASSTAMPSRTLRVSRASAKWIPLPRAASCRPSSLLRRLFRQRFPAFQALYEQRYASFAQQLIIRESTGGQQFFSTFCQNDLRAAYALANCGRI